MEKRLSIVSMVFAVALVSSQSWAQTYQTNIEGVILKNVGCVKGSLSNYIKFNVSNRSSKHISGQLLVTIFDSDGDPIDSGSTDISVGPVSGNKELISVDCSAAAKYAFRIE